MSNVVVIVDRGNWQPSSPLDRPPHFEVEQLSTPLMAEEFARHFNQLEMENPRGTWAVPLEKRE